MLLKLSIVSYHRLSPRQTVFKHFDSKGGLIGRSEQSDWHLPDPARVISSSHARIQKRKDGFYVEDLSTNGLFINHAVEPVGQGNTHKLVEGDILCLGDYELKVETGKAETTNIAQNNASLSKSESLLKSEPLPFNPSQELLSTSAPHNIVEQLGGGIPVDHFNLDIHNTNDPLASLTVSNVLDDHFLPPKPEIPEEWDSQWTTDESAEKVQSSLPVVDNENTRTQEEASIQEQTAPQEENNRCEEPRPQSGIELAAFFKGMGLSQQVIPKDADEHWWAQLGVVYKDLLMGLTGTLRARSEVKAEFRVNQTMFRQKENNPLKFSATLDDVFHNLFNRAGPSFLPPEKAIDDAFEDINLHENALLKASRASFLGLLKQLSPDIIETNNQARSFSDKVNPAKRQAKCWSVYRELHADIEAELKENQQSMVNTDFTTAYEASLRSRQKGQG